MTNTIRHQIGLSLLEVMLVLAIGAMILLMGLQQYLSFKRDSDIRSVQYNVDVIFAALGRYYQANCAKEDSPLLPANRTFKSAVAVSWSDLTPFMTGSLISSPLIDYTDGSGYIVQFNLKLPIPERRINMSNPVNSSQPIGQIILYQSQVAFKFKEQANASTYQTLLLADCLSTRGSDNTVSQCTGIDPSSGDYAVWSRSPSMVLSNTTNYWVNKQANKLFTQMYTTNPILSLTDRNLTSNQYYVCGS